MITREQMMSIGYTVNKQEPDLYVVYGSWEYGFNIKTQELWHLNDGYGDPEFLVKITNFEKLKNLLELFGEIY
jgi:hypothetical protein